MSKFFEPKQGDRADVMEALRDVTGFDVVRVRTGFDAAGAAQYAEGYEAMADGGVKFFNEKGQEVHVPKHRVDESLAAASQPREGDEAEATPGPATPGPATPKPATSKPAAAK